jgi:predicted kinase
MEEPRAVAHLPHLEIEIVHRQLPGEQAEQLAISLRATPSLDAFARHLEAQAPMWPWLALNPFLVWQRMLQAAWRPWLEAHPAVTAGRVTRGE